MTMLQPVPPHDARALKQIGWVTPCCGGYSHIQAIDKHLSAMHSSICRDRITLPVYVPEFDADDFRKIICPCGLKFDSLREYAAHARDFIGDIS